MKEYVKKSIDFLDLGCEISRRNSNLKIWLLDEEDFSKGLLIDAKRTLKSKAKILINSELEVEWISLKRKDQALIREIESILEWHIIELREKQMQNIEFAEEEIGEHWHHFQTCVDIPQDDVDEYIEEYGCYYWAEKEGFPNNAISSIESSTTGDAEKTFIEYTVYLENWWIREQAYA